MNTRIVLIFLLVAVSVCQKSVVELNQDNFESYIKTEKMGFVEFYSPNCQHCQTIEPVYEQTAKLVKEKGMGVVFARINGDQFPEMMSKYDIIETPIIVWFDNNHSQLVPYTGDTEMPSNFIDYIEKQLKYKTPELTFTMWKKMVQTPTHPRNYTSQNVLILVGDKQKQLDHFNHITNSAWNVDLREIYWTNDKEFKTYYELSEEGDKLPFNVLIFKVRDNTTVSIDRFETIKLTVEELTSPRDIKISSSNFKVENVLRLYSKEIVNIFSNKNEKMIVLAIPSFILAHNFEFGTKSYDDMINALTQVAILYRKEIFFMHGSLSTKFTQIFTESYRLFVSDFPVMCFSSGSDSNPDAIEKYKRVLPKGQVPATEDIIRFIEDWKTFSLKPYISSEVIPTIIVDENGIIKLVGDTIKKTLTTQGIDVVLVLCTDRLEICTKFREIYARVARKLKSNEKIMFTEINPYDNEIEFMGYDMMPGLIVFADKGNKPNDFVEYKGKLTTREIIKFIKENVAHRLTKEDTLPVEEVLFKKEEINEIKAVNLEEKGVARKLYDKIIDPDQKDLYKIADKAVVKKEREYLERKLDMTVQKKLKILTDDL